jgi:hypothetical protein
MATNQRKIILMSSKLGQLPFSLREKVPAGRMRERCFVVPQKPACELAPSSGATRHLVPRGEGKPVSFDANQDGEY